MSGRSSSFKFGGVLLTLFLSSLFSSSHGEPQAPRVDSTPESSLHTSNNAANAAQPRPQTRRVAGSFDRLPPSDQKIARAIFAAQTTPRTHPDSEVSLDQLAYRHRTDRKSWTSIFLALKREGRVRGNNLDAAVNAFNERPQSSTRRSASSSNTVAT